ncbi:DNA damage-inducible protein D [Sphingomonas sp. ZB1N12]|jgi:DNA-damage-inducible protein D|uniref:DNA damage-inducible protein D n=1 Tax=Sphingomonas arabinosi TaxID=3096160 RepID=UPI002FC800EB
MSDDLAPALAGISAFEGEKLYNDHGAEFWSARDLQPLLGYSQWRRFEDAIRRGMSSCEQSGNTCDHHFSAASKPISGGKGAVQVVDDYHLSRFACYLIAQNGDPRKPAIAQAQKYFAVQTRRQELSDNHTADVERLEMRKQISEEFKNLSGAARGAGVADRRFGIFHDAGYRGMYDGRGVEAIKTAKGVPSRDNLMDRMNSTELAANQFRMTQTRDKLAREGIRGEQRAIDAHHSVGREVRAAITKIGGTMPEHIPADEHIKHVEKRVKMAQPRVALEGPEATGLLGPSKLEHDNKS